MSKRRDVLLALKALVTDALPYARVRGFDDDPVKPSRGDPGGDVLGYPGDPGEPEVMLSPLTHSYDHEIVLEVSPPAGSPDGDALLDEMMSAIGTAIVGARELGGLCDWLEARMPDTNDRIVDGSAGTRWARLPVIATYTTTDPLN